MKAIKPAAMGPNKTPKNALKPYAVWNWVSGTQDGILTYMNKLMLDFIIDNLKYYLTTPGAFLALILSIPAILGAAVVQLKDLPAMDANIGAYIAGFIVAAISGYLAIKFLLKIIQEKSLDVFAYYCWIVGIIVLIGSLALGW